jgi:hypothetical protein
MLCRFICQFCGLLRGLVLRGFGGTLLCLLGGPLLGCLKCKLCGPLGSLMFSGFGGALCRLLCGLLFGGVRSLSSSFNLVQAFCFALRSLERGPSFRFLRYRQGILVRRMLHRRLRISLRSLLSCPLCPFCCALGFGGPLRVGGSLYCGDPFGLSGSFSIGYQF